MTLTASPDRNSNIQRQHTQKQQDLVLHDAQQAAQLAAQEAAQQQAAQQAAQQQAAPRNEKLCPMQSAPHMKRKECAPGYLQDVDSGVLVVCIV